MTLRVGHKIVAGFGLLIVLTFGLGWYQLSNIQKMADISIGIVENDFETLLLVRQAGNARRDMAVLFESTWAAYLLKKANAGSKDPAVYQNDWSLMFERWRGNILELASSAEQQENAAFSEAHRQLSQQLRAVTQEMQKTAEETRVTSTALFDLMLRGDLAAYPSRHDVLLRLRADAATQGSEAERLTTQLALGAKQAITDLHASVSSASLIALAAVLLSGTLVAFVIYRSITVPLGHFMKFVERVGSGDLTRRLETTGSDEFGRLGGHLNEMVGNLNETAKQIRVATENLNAAAAEMQASVQQNAAGANEQSSAIQQITSTLSEITRSGAQIAERAKAVASTAEAAAAASKSGLQSVNETTRAMTAIREQAEKVAGNVVSLTEKTQSIGTTIATVNDLAERSSLLALNAAIEAAAAGEYGQSFAVVADEIKNLASQAKDATVEVRATLSDIQHGIGAAVMQTEEAVKRVESGKEQAVATEQTINNLTRSIEQSVATFEQIVAATNQQQVGIEQVTQSVHGIREASEQMASGTKDVGRAASSLAALSSQLQRMAERYQV